MLRTLALAVSALVAVAHVYFLVLEMFLWTTPFGQRTFKRTEAQQRDTAPLAKNQGLYNGFLAAGIVWGLSAYGADPAHALSLLTFFLGCVLVAGVYGAYTASRSILYVQALPALVALLLLLLS